MNAIYARQSVDKKDSLSIDGQISLCKKYAGEDALLFQDRGFSGKTVKRPAFTELLEAIESGSVRKVFVYRLDRFSRSIADFSRLWELLEKHGVSFYSVTESFDTASPMGRAMLNIVLVFAQLERETIAERVKDNYLHRFSLGAWPGGPAPYGFDLTKTVAAGRLVSSLSANEAAGVVLQIFEAYARPEASLRSIAKELSQQGIHGPRREVWDSVTLSRLLRSPLYVCADKEVYWYYASLGLQIRQDIAAFDGIHACNVIGRRDRSCGKYRSPAGQRLTIANHKGFVPSALWLLVQGKLAGNAPFSGAGAGKHSWLTGLLKCGKCGYAVKINFSKSEKRAYLLCSGRSNLRVCDAFLQIDLRELEAQVAKQLQEMLAVCSEIELFPERQDRASEILEIERKIERLVRALSQVSEISAEYISKQLEALHGQRKALLSRDAHSARQGLSLDFHAAGFEEKKLIAAQFIDKILLDGETVHILWKV